MSIRNEVSWRRFWILAGISIPAVIIGVFIFIYMVNANWVTSPMGKLTVFVSISIFFTGTMAGEEGIKLFLTLRRRGISIREVPDSTT